MRLRDKFRLLAIGLLLAFAAAFAVAASATPFAETAPQVAFASDFGESAPEHAPACFKRHDPCKPAGIAAALPASATAHAIPGGPLAKPPALLPPPMRDVAPHAAASLSILFRNFRE